jgi:hypothetical protein
MILWEVTNPDNEKDTIMFCPSLTGKTSAVITGAETKINLIYKNFKKQRRRVYWGHCQSRRKQ